MYNNYYTQVHIVLVACTFTCTCTCIHVHLHVHACVHTCTGTGIDSLAYVPSCCLQGIVVSFNELFEAEVVLVAEVVDEVGEWYLVSVEDECL